MEEVHADRPTDLDAASRVWLGLPSPSPYPPHLRKRAVPRTERALFAEGGSPAPGEKGGPSPPPARPWGRRGRGSWGKGAFVFLTHLSRQLLGGGAGKERCGPAALPTAAPPPSLPSVPRHHPPQPTGAVGLEEGAPESFKVIALPQASHIVPAILPGI